MSAAGPRDRNHQAAPPRPSGGGARGPGGDCGEPPLPPTPPQARGRPEPAGETAASYPPGGGALHLGGGRHSRGERSRAPSAPGRPPANSCITRCRQAALCRRRGPQRNGGTQEGADEAARLGARLGKAGKQTVARRRLPPPRPNVYTQGGCTGEEGGQGRGPRDGAAPPPLSPPLPPPVCGPRERRPSSPPGGRGDAPPPQK